MSTPLTHEEALLKEVVSEIASDVAKVHKALDEEEDELLESFTQESYNADNEVTESAGTGNSETDHTSEQQTNNIPLRRISRHPSSAFRRKKNNMGYPLLVLAGAIAVAVLVQKIFGEHVDVIKPRTKRFPVCREGAVVITDAAYGHARQTALLLADQGFHVLAGVRTKAEERSFMYDARKGLEPFRMDLTEPNEIAKLYYRLRFVNAELRRPLYGILVNTADSVLDADKAKAPSPPMLRDLSAVGGFNATHMQLVAKQVIDVPALDDGYNWSVKGPLRVLQGALELFATANDAYEVKRVAAAAQEHCAADGTCTAADTPRITPATETQKKSPKKRVKRTDDAALCEAGATARIVFMTFDEELLVQKPPESPKKRGLSSWLPAKRPPREIKPEYRRNDTVSKSSEIQVSTAGLSKEVCGAPCALNSALRAYADQLEGALWDSEIAVSRLSVSSQPYRSKSAKPSHKESDISAEADEIAKRERQWVEVVAPVPVAPESEKNATNKPRKARKVLFGSVFKASKPNSTFMIDSKYSLEANQAAHAFLSTLPRQVYDDHQKARKRRPKFLGL